MFWNHTLLLEWIEPDQTSLLDNKKYSYWDNQIRTVYGVSAMFTGTAETSGQAIGNSILNLKGTEEECTEAQEAFLEFFNRELEMLKAALGISATVKAGFDRMNLKDEVKFRAVLSAAVMNGVIDHQTALETLGYHFPEVVTRMKKVKEMQDKDGIFLPIASANNMGPGGGTPTGGKPANDQLADNNDNKKGKSQPKLKAAARVVPMTSTEARVVVDGDLDLEQRQQTAEWFGIPTDWVCTEAEYEQQYGDLPPAPWPELSTVEVFAATATAATLCASLDTNTDAALVAQVKPGQYKTQAKRTLAREQAVATTMSGFLTELTGVAEAPAGWTDYVRMTRQQILEAMPGATENQIESQAVAICAARWRKSQAAHAVPSSEGGDGGESHDTDTA